MRLFLTTIMIGVAFWAQATMPRAEAATEAMHAPYESKVMHVIWPLADDEKDCAPVIDA